MHLSLTAEAALEFLNSSLYYIRPKQRFYYCFFPQESLVKDFRDLYVTVKNMGLLNASYLFFFFLFLHILLLDIISWAIIWYYGSSLVPFLISLVIYATAQVM